MSDRPQFDDSKGSRADAYRLPDLDATEILRSSGPSISNQFRNTQMQQEKGPPPIDPTRNNRWKFPADTTSKDWWPVDSPVPKAPHWPFSKEDSALGYGVHWADQPRLLPPMPGDRPNPPGPGPGPGPGPVDGPITKPDQIQTPRNTDEYARKSVNINADARSIYMTAGLTGLGVGTGVHVADIYTGSIAPEARTGAVAFWRNNLSPSQRLVPERSALLKTIEAQIPGLETTANAASHTFARHDRFRTELAGTLLNQAPSPIPAADKAWYEARVALVKNDAQFTAQGIGAATGTDAEVLARTKLFTQAEATPMVSQANDFWQASRENIAAKGALDAGNASRNKATQLLVQAERGSITTGSEAMLKGIGSGLLVASGTVLADNLLDRALGNNPELSNSAHWGIQGIGVPLLLLSKATLPTKILGSLAMVGTSHLMDKYLGPPSGIFSPFARPSLPEIGLATAGALMPVQDMRLRAGLAVGGWALGKTWNYLDAKYELTGRTEPRLQYETLASVDHDMKSPSTARFMFAQDQMKSFSNRNDAASSVLVKDWQTASNSQTAIDKGRGNAALMMGLGESMLERGARIDRDKWDKNGEHIGAGLSYDLGGQASSYLRAANGNLQETLRLARENKGRSIASGTIDDAYISQLDYLQTMSKQSLERVYGAHDIRAVYTDIRNHVRSNPNEMNTFGETLAQYSRTLPDSEPRYKAKINRDLALIHIAFGDSDPTTGGQRAHFEKAQSYLDQSFRSDPNAADNSQIRLLLNPASR